MIIACCEEMIHMSLDAEVPLTPLEPPAPGKFASLVRSVPILGGLVEYYRWRRYRQSVGKRIESVLASRAPAPPTLRPPDPAYVAARAALNRAVQKHLGWQAERFRESDPMVLVTWARGDDLDIEWVCDELEDWLGTTEMRDALFHRLHHGSLGDAVAWLAIHRRIEERA
jgi:hypothetical protein